MLRSDESRKRQLRLRAIMAQRHLDAVVVGLRHHAYYFSAHLPFWMHEGAMVVFRDGPAILIAANGDPGTAAADQILPYTAHFNNTMRQEQPFAVAELVLELLKKHHAHWIGVDASPVTAQVAIKFGVACTGIDEALWQLRRVKDPDELVLMRKAIECTEAMYRVARNVIVPGVSELAVYGALHTAAVEAAGEPLSAWLGNDFRCGALGGPPRANRLAEAGEIYILDLGPAYRGYYADNARSIAVDRSPTPAQLDVQAAILEVLAQVESLARPGVPCRALYEEASNLLLERTGTGMVHHLGHGVGLQLHEFPHLNPAWDDILMEGEIFTVEPGQYAPELGGGIRIENQYLVTADGVENLVQAPTNLA